MSRDPEPYPDQAGGTGEAGPPDEPTGTLRPTSPTTIAAWAIAGLVLGWLAHPLGERWGGTAPIVTWSQVLALFLIAAVLGGTAWFTWRTLHVEGGRLAPHQAVNRLVLARASALVGALVAGGYLGYALSWLGVDAELASQRVWRSAFAAVAGVLVVATSVALERACRVRREGS